MPCALYERRGQQLVEVQVTEGVQGRGAGGGGGKGALGWEGGREEELIRVCVCGGELIRMWGQLIRVHVWGGSG